MQRTFLAIAGVSLAISLVAACSDSNKEVGANPPDGAGNGGAAGAAGAAAGASGKGGSGQPAGSAGTGGSQAGSGGSAGSPGCGAEPPPSDCNEESEVGKACGTSGTCVHAKCVSPDGTPVYICSEAGGGGSAGSGGSTGCGSETPPASDCDELSEVGKACGNGGTCLTANCVNPDGTPVFLCSGSAGAGGGAGSPGCGPDTPPPSDCDEASDLGKACGNGGTCFTTNCVGPDGKPVFYCSQPGAAGSGGGAGSPGCGAEPPPSDCNEESEVGKACGTSGTCVHAKCVNPDGTPVYICSESGSGGSGGSASCGPGTPPTSDCDEPGEVGKACGNGGMCLTTNCVNPDGTPVYVCSASGSGGSAGSGGGTGCGSGAPPASDCDEPSEVGKACGGGGMCLTTNCVGPDGKPVYFCDVTGKPCGGDASMDCGPKHYCDFDAQVLCGAADHQGVCKPRPQSCDEPCDTESASVCACDGKLYCTACEAHKAGFDDAAKEYCAN